MKTVTASNFMNDFASYFRQTVKNNQLVTIADENGAGVFMSEEDYNGLIATLELTANPRFVSELNAADIQPLGECRVYTNDEKW
ncbi:hypothetical protein FACS1894163_11100 [Spirochaetia bacterium]|nr:hypothetical protein FACS1894163_11100 [Spirochaetia bacterium]